MNYVDLTPEVLARINAEGLADRRARGEIMTYVKDGWVFREHPGQRIERLCPLEEFVAADYPLPPKKMALIESKAA